MPTPVYGSNDDLRGRANCVAYTDYFVVVYIRVGKTWWVKPYSASPLTSIQSDGTWVCDITTGGNDPYATEIAAFLISDTVDPPRLLNAGTLPDVLFEESVDYRMIDRRRTIEFSDRIWRVEVYPLPVDPGPVRFSDRPEDVWVDGDGRLHLTITFRDGQWYGTEVLTEAPLGYGVYAFTLASRVDSLDKNVVVGLYTYDDTDEGYAHHEIDVEFSRWGLDTGPNSQYVVQPYSKPGNRHQFTMTLLSDYSVHSFGWGTLAVRFTSFQGRTSPPDPGDLIESWVYAGPDLPPAKVGRARINLWLLGGNPPSDGQDVEVIVEAFEFRTSLHLPLILRQVGS